MLMLDVSKPIPAPKLRVITCYWAEHYYTHLVLRMLLEEVTTYPYIYHDALIGDLLKGDATVQAMHQIGHTYAASGGSWYDWVPMSRKVWDNLAAVPRTMTYTMGSSGANLIGPQGDVTNPVPLNRGCSTSKVRQQFDEAKRMLPEPYNTNLAWGIDSPFGIEQRTWLLSAARLELYKYLEKIDHPFIRRVRFETGTPYAFKCRVTSGKGASDWFTLHRRNQRSVLRNYAHLLG